MTEICHPEWITVTADGSAHKGYDQDWYCLLYTSDAADEL